MIGPNRFETRNRLVATVVVALIAVAAMLQAADEKSAKKTREVKAGKLTLTVPENWKQGDQERPMRAADFTVPPAGDDKESGEFVVFDFGDRGVGSKVDNIRRWIGQFEDAGRKVKIVSGESANGKYTLVDLSGTYKKSIGPMIQQQTKAMPNWRVINVFLESKSGIYTLRLDGPAKTVAALEDDVRTAFGAKKDSEKEEKAP